MQMICKNSADQNVNSMLQYGNFIMI